MTGCWRRESKRSVIRRAALRGYRRLLFLLQKAVPSCSQTRSPDRDRREYSSPEQFTGGGNQRHRLNCHFCGCYVETENKAQSSWPARIHSRFGAGGLSIVGGELETRLHTNQVLEGIPRTHIQRWRKGSNECKWQLFFTSSVFTDVSSQQ